ncbi:MAG: hypothetical protein WAN93_11685 [Solirubrobacteraceae bacterium]
MPLNGRLDEFGAHIGPLGAGRAVDTGATEEVGVLLAVAPGRDTERQPVAALAVDAAAQVVLANPRALPGNPLLIKQRLHLVKGRLVDERFMATLKRLFILGTSPIDNLPDVVGVAEQALYDSGAQFLGYPLGGWSGTQAQVL